MKLFNLIALLLFVRNPKKFATDFLQGIGVIAFFFANLLILALIEENTAIVFDHPIIITFASMIVEAFLAYCLYDAYKTKDDVLLLNLIKLIGCFVINFVLCLILNFLHPYIISFIITGIYGAYLSDKTLKNSSK